VIGEASSLMLASYTEIFFIIPASMCRPDKKKKERRAKEKETLMGD
jgi:hypothetical protein